MISIFLSLILGFFLAAVIGTLAAGLLVRLIGARFFRVCDLAKQLEVLEETGKVSVRRCDEPDGNKIKWEFSVPRQQFYLEEERTQTGELLQKLTFPRFASFIFGSDDLLQVDQKYNHWHADEELVRVQAKHLLGIVCRLVSEKIERAELVDSDPAA